MGFKNKIKGLNEDQIKKFMKRSVMDGTSKKMLKSRVLKKSKYLQDIAMESANELGDLVEFVERHIECPIERLDYINKTLQW